MSEVLRLAIQKKGRLSDDSLKLIKECGISVSTRSAILKATANNFLWKSFSLGMMIFQDTWRME